MVHMGAYFDRSVDCVGIDLRAGAEAAVRHLVRAGCRRIAYLVPEYFNSEGDDRREGYRTVMRESGLEPEFVESRISNRQGATEAVMAHVREKGCPDGFFCFNDDQAIGARRGLRNLGIRVPEDARLVGCDGIEDTVYQDPPISTVVQPLAEMCARAWEFLERRMENPNQPRQEVILVPELVVRGSSDPTAASSEP